MPIRNFSWSESRLKNRFNFVVSNRDFQQMFDFVGAPEERTCLLTETRIFIG